MHHCERYGGTDRARSSCRMYLYITPHTIKRGRLNTHTVTRGLVARINKADTPTAATQRVSGNGDRSTDRTGLCEYSLISLEFNIVFNCDYGNQMCLKC